MPQYPAIKLLLTLAAIALLSSEIMAQSSADLNDANLEQLMKAKVYGASKYLQDQRDAPAFVTVITADEIQRHGYRTLAEVLQAAGGFYITNDRDYSYVGVRGFSRPGDYNSRILLLVDGHRLNDALYDMAMVGTEMPLDVDMIERVEVIRGSGASLYGTSAFLAVINVVTRKANDVGGLEVNADAGSFGTGHGRITYGGTYRGVEMLFSGSFYGDSGPVLFFPEFDRPSSNYGICNGCDGYRGRNFLADLSYRNWSVDVLYGRRDKDSATAPFGSVFGDPRNSLADIRSYVELGYRRKFAGWDLWARGSFDRYSYLDDYVYAYDDSGKLTANLDIEAAEGWGTEWNLSRSLKRQQVSLGGEFRDNYRQDRRNFDLVPFLPYYNMRLDSKMGALYLQDEITLTRRLLVNFGLRHDQYSTFGGDTNPRLALIFRATPRTTLKAIYSTAFRAPNVNEAYSGDGILNHKLIPEDISSSEIVLEQVLGRHVKITGSAYHNRINNLISYVALDQEGSIFRNEGHATLIGIDTELSAKYGDRFEGRASYSYVAERSSSNPVNLVNSPMHVASAGFSAHLATRIYASADSSYVSRRDTLAGTGVSGRTLVNLSFLAQQKKSFDFKAGVYNLLNKKYADPGFQWHVQDHLVQDGRSFRIGIVYHFGGSR